jgi:hypothetical protein
VVLEKFHTEFLLEFYHQIVPVLLPTKNQSHPQLRHNVYDKIIALNDIHHRESSELISQNVLRANEASTHLSTWMNLSYELHHYVHYMLSSLLPPLGDTD